jgi:hypothetical protein
MCALVTDLQAWSGHPLGFTNATSVEFAQPTRLVFIGFVPSTVMQPRFFGGCLGVERQKKTTEIPICVGKSHTKGSWYLSIKSEDLEVLGVAPPTAAKIVHTLVQGCRGTRDILLVTRVSVQIVHQLILGAKRVPTARLRRMHNSLSLAPQQQVGSPSSAGMDVLTPRHLFVHDSKTVDLPIDLVAMLCTSTLRGKATDGIVCCNQVVWIMLLWTNCSKTGTGFGSSKVLSERSISRCVRKHADRDSVKLANSV